MVLRTSFSLAWGGSFRLPSSAPPGFVVDPFYLVVRSGVEGAVAIYPPLGSLLRAAIERAAMAVPPGSARGRVTDAAFLLLPILALALAVFPVSRLARYGGASPRGAPWLAAGLLLCTFVGPLGGSDFQEPFLVLFLPAALCFTLQGVRRRGPRRNRDLALAGVLFGLALLAKPTAGLVLPALLLAVVWPSPRRRVALDLAAFCGGAMPGIAAFLGLNAVRFGSPWELGYATQTSHPLARTVNPLWTSARLLVLPNRGLLFFAPVVLLAFRRRHWKGGIVLPALGCAAAVFATNVAWWAWEGGFGWGPRLLAPAVPLLAPLLAGRGKRWAAALALLAGAGFLVNLPGYLLDYGRVYDRAARLPARAPLGPVVPMHRDPAAPDGIYPQQRVHYVPADASWLLAPPIVVEVLAGTGAGSSAFQAGTERNDAVLVRLRGGRPLFPSGPLVASLLLGEGYLWEAEDPGRALRLTAAAIGFGAPEPPALAFASALLLRAGKPAEAAALCRRGLALGERADLRANLELAEGMLRAAGAAR